MNNIWNKITLLARLKMPEKEEKHLISQVQKIVAFFEHISSAPTDSTEPLTTPFNDKLPFRKDEHKSFNKDLLKQAPSLNGQYVQVPKVVSTLKKEI